MNSQFDSANNNNSNNRVKQQLNAKWNRVDDASGGPTPRPRHGHRGVAIKELMLVFGGGNEGIVDELHVYDVAKNKWFVPVVRGDIPRGFAAYGMVSLIGQGKVFIFGGMVEYGKYSNDVYELQTTRWEWRNLRVRPAQNTAGPCPRLGHSFTLGLDYYAYVFGGLANESADPKMNQPRYLNDLYVINLGSPTNSLYWEYIETNGISPPPRESHSAVHFVTSNGKEQLIIYGGMDGQRMNDVWILDLMNMNWSNPLPHGMTPLPRSLHTANVIGNRMFIFGGWVPMEPQDKIEHPDKEWKCTNTMAVLNLNSLIWEQPVEPTADLKGIEPGARAGHSAVVINKRVYIWSGRDGYKKTWNSQVCCDDMWYLEVDVPAAPAAIQLVRASVNSLEIQWPIISNAEQYLLQIQKVEQQEDQKVQTGGRRIIRAAMPLTQQPGVVRMRPGVYYRQQRPVMMVQRSPVVGGLSNSYPAGIRMSPANAMIQTQTPSPQQRVIMQKTVAGGGAESGTPQQQKIMVLQQAGVSAGQAPYVQVQSIQPQQSGSFNVLQSQAEQQTTPTYISNTTATTKTTYTAPVAPAIDQMMPTNILDEALNEAESFVDEQLQQQKQFQQDHDTTTTSNVDQNSVEKNRDAEAKEEKETNAKKDEDVEQFSMEQMRATPDDLKEGNDIKESDQTQQSQQENEPLSEDMPIKDVGGEEQQESSQQSGPTTSSEHPPHESDVSKQQNATSTAVESEQETPSYASDEPVNSNKQSAAASQSLDQAGQQQPMAAQKAYPGQEEWCDVATLTENKIVVTEYSNSKDQKKSLEPGVFYRFRVCAINSVGQSKWSPANNFKTCIPGFPGAPSNIKITKGPDGAHLSWEPPQTTNGQIVEYTVYLAMRSSSQPAFVPVYIGQTANCVVNHQNLNLAHIDLHPKAAIIFRIAARNEKGYGPATQVRWLQDQRPMAPMQQMAGSLKRIHPATATYQSPTMHQQQQMVHAPAGGYYAQISGPPRYVLQQSPVGIPAGNLAMVQPQAMGQQKIQSTPTIAIQHSPVGNVYGFSSSSPQYQQQPVQVHIQRQQQANISPQQMPHAAMIHQQQGEEGGEGMPQDEAINSGMTVREYLTGAGKKKLRMEQSQ